MSKYNYSNDYERQETEKYEGVYTPEEAALNRALLEECLKENADLSLAEELLKRGADPLGGTAEYGWDLLVHVYGELVIETIHEDIKLPEITELFLKYGMEVSSPRVPYDNENSIHVLRYLPENEKGAVTLKLLLDYGTDADAVGEFWDRFVFGEYNVHKEDPNDEEWNDYFVWALKMIMLIASYDHVLENDEWLRALIGCSYNSYDIHKFRNWNDYRYEFDTSRCERFPELYKCVVRIYSVDSGEEVWKIGFRLKEGEF